jgi:endonuclease YncB( thermonuclease family)
MPRRVLMGRSREDGKGAASLLVALVLIGLWAVGQLAPGWIPPGWPLPGGGRVCDLDRVIDGDSLRVSCDGEPLEIRLHCIDAPERDQKPWARRSRAHLQSIASPRLEVRALDRDRFGRTIAEVFTVGPERRSLNLEQIRGGQAAVYTRFCDESRFLRAERAARTAGIGIWERAGGHQTPWIHRQRR